MSDHPAVHAILGPCRCQRCGGEVLYIRQGNLTGWLHEDGRLTCQVIARGSYGDRREYRRLWKRRYDTRRRAA